MYLITLALADSVFEVPKEAQRISLRGTAFSKDYNSSYFDSEICHIMRFSVLNISFTFPFPQRLMF
jgi:hypothetical protein